MARIDDGMEAHSRGKWIHQCPVEFIVHYLPGTAVVSGQDGFIHSIGFLSRIITLLGAMTCVGCVGGAAQGRANLKSERQASRQGRCSKRAK